MILIEDIVLRQACTVAEHDDVSGNIGGVVMRLPEFLHSVSKELAPMGRHMAVNHAAHTLMDVTALGGTGDPQVAGRHIP